MVNDTTAHVCVHKVLAVTDGLQEGDISSYQVQYAIGVGMGEE